MRQDGQCRAACYQVSDCQTQAALAACGNTTAAACALEAWLTGAGSAATWVELADQTSIRVQTEFSVGPAASYVVRQTWHDVPLHLCEERLLSGRYCAAWLGPLNNYLVVRARAGEDPAEFTLAEATHLWRCFGLDRQPLLARLAVVDPATQPCPRVKFFTCGEREHPSAPLTGLAVLALAAQRQNWRQLALCQRVITPAGPMTLPTVQAARDREVTIEFPPVRVEQNCHWTFTPEQRHGWW
jgi:hypothetical protein